VVPHPAHVTHSAATATMAVLSFFFRCISIDRRAGAQVLVVGTAEQHLAPYFFGLTSRM
jgi:hypothetical protein